MKLLIIDNYDSFTYNLVQIIEQSGICTFDVLRNDKFDLEDVHAYDKILISPGPGVPMEAGLTRLVIDQYGASKSILGVCLGHQAIGEVYGNSLENLDEVKHGIGSEINVDNQDYLFAGLPEKITVGRYHSWVISNKTKLKDLDIIGTAENGEIMAVRHLKYDVRGVQFHPESILTPQGSIIITNFLKH